MEIVPISVDGYERVVRGEDRERGFRGIIAVHDTTLGPALGGMRMWDYAGWDEALRDVVRLAEGMTYKSAVARTGLGGGKAVILGDARKEKSEELFRFMGRLVDSLGGQYITAEDVGTSVPDLDVVSQETRWVTGRAREVGGSGDPSPYTALGTFLSIGVSLEEALGPGTSVSGRSVAVQGLGHVGYWLCKHLHEAGARLVVTDLHEERAQRAQREFGAAIVGLEEIYDVECDVFAPCALGAVLDDETIPRLKCKVVCGAANNQLADEGHAKQLQDAGILYAPDYVVNAGGVLNISVELDDGGYDERRADDRVRTIGPSLQAVFSQARRRGITTDEAALEVAEAVLREGRPDTETVNS